MTEADREKIKKLWESRATILEITRLFPYKPFHIRKEIKWMLEMGVLQPRSRRKMLVEKIKEHYDAGITDKYELAEIFEVSTSTIVHALQGYGEKEKRPSHNYKQRKLNETALAIIEDIKVGEKSLSEISKDFGVSRQYVHQLSKRVTR